MNTLEDARQRAAKSSFYRAMAILPRAKRQAMFEIYSFCRAVDDIADDGGPSAQRKAELAQWRAAIDDLYRDPPTQDGLSAGLVEPLLQFHFDKQDFLAVIDGMEMDVDEAICAPDIEKFDCYCDRVASAVGRLAVKIFGLPSTEGIDLAHHLGRALQITNILRDIDEDAALGRLYLPRDYFEAAGFAIKTPRDAIDLPDLDPVCAPLVERARQHFSAADAVMAERRRAEIRAPAIMSLVYRDLLDQLAARGFTRPRAAVKKSKAVLARAILRYGFF